MANISVGELDFGLLADAANNAAERGDRYAANGLDKLARKVNAALSASSLLAVGTRTLAGGGVKRIGWRDVPSTLVSAARTEPTGGNDGE